MAKKRNQAAKKREWLNFDKAMLLLLIISLFAIVKTAFMPDEDTELAKEAEIVLDKLTNGYDKISLLNSNELVAEKVAKLGQMNYNEVKNMLGVKNDFCIYFEDATGNAIRIDGINTGIGSNRIYINGQPCE